MNLKSRRDPAAVDENRNPDNDGHSSMASHQPLRHHCFSTPGERMLLIQDDSIPQSSVQTRTKEKKNCFVNCMHTPGLVTLTAELYSAGEL